VTHPPRQARSRAREKCSRSVPRGSCESLLRKSERKMRRSASLANHRGASAVQTDEGELRAAHNAAADLDTVIDPVDGRCVARSTERRGSRWSDAAHWSTEASSFSPSGAGGPAPQGRRDDAG